MKMVNIHYAKTHLSRLIEEAVKGESFIIAKAGKPMVKVERAAPVHERLGFLEGKFNVPDDFDTMFEKEIEEMFYGEGDEADAAKR
jgi:antitoxin (DNA-binding transcriptional repressor) of toxin-antitoxin stability system